MANISVCGRGQEKQTDNKCKALFLLYVLLLGEKTASFDHSRRVGRRRAAQEDISYHQLTCCPSSDSIEYCCSLQKPKKNCSNKL